MLHEMIVARADLLKELRAFFDARGFYETQPPCLSADCVVDAYIDSITIPARAMSLPIDRGREQFFLQSSAESAMKRMLVDGAPSIYSIGPVFRAGEIGPIHNLEFIMLEWYHLNSKIDDEIELVRQLACAMLGQSHCGVITYADAFLKYAGFHPLQIPLLDLERQVTKIDGELAASIRDDRDAMLDVLMSELIQPRLGTDSPVVLRDYPATQAALARVLPDDPRFAARFELYYRGVELANGYEELLDAEELVRRGEDNNTKRIESGRNALNVETGLVRAMRRGMPPCAGVALGVDRLLMLRRNASRLDQVMPLTIDRA